MNRRQFLTIAGGVVLFSGVTSQLGLAQGDDDESLRFVVHAPGVESATLTAFLNAGDGAASDEPLLLVFVLYEFEDDHGAEEAFSDVALGVEQGMTEAMSNTGRPMDERRVSEVSIGRLGDDRFAVVNRAENYASQMWAAVRVGSEVLTTQSAGVSPDHIDFVVDWLEGHLENVSALGVSLLPELADLPVGWEVQLSAQDVTSDVPDLPPATPST